MTRSRLIEWRTAILDSDVGSNARLVAFVLSTHMDRHGGSCFPSLTTLEREARLSRRGVCYALDELERAGLIERTRRRPKPTRYRAASAHGALAVVHTVHPGSAPGAHEDVQEDVQRTSTRAQTRARGKRARPAAAGALTPEEEAQLANLP